MEVGIELEKEVGEEMRMEVGEGGGEGGEDVVAGHGGGEGNG